MWSLRQQSRDSKLQGLPRSSYVHPKSTTAMVSKSLQSAVWLDFFSRIAPRVTGTRKLSHRSTHVHASDGCASASVDEAICFSP